MKTILITGSTDGIGKQTALELAQQGHKVIIHGRNLKKCKQTAAEIDTIVPGADLDCVAADFSELKQVREMVKDVTQRFPELNVLINNAGIFSPTYQLSQDGIEINWAVNYLALVVLTEGLLSVLKKNAPARIINVSSVAHQRGRLDFQNLVMGEENYHGYRAYSNSKLAVICYTNLLANQNNVDEVTVNSLHPGVITTKMLKAGFNMTGDSLSVGAETPVYLATSPVVERITGGYFDTKQIVTSSKYTYDVDLQGRLWQETIKMIQD